MPQAQTPTTLRQRLQLLARSHSQAELARRTGFPPANVHRFLKGGKVPAEFCEALVRGFGVNPAWLLAGEGTAYLTDVPDQTARMAGNLLELVEAMSAVARMRLGSLAGKHHLKVLRELNDALTRYESLRLRLNEQSRPIFQRLLEDLDKVLGRQELDRALELMKATEQVARLSDDASLGLHFDKLRTFAAYLSRDFERAVEFERKVFIRELVGGAKLDDAVADRLHNFVLSLTATGRLREARRVCHAALALAADANSESSVLLALKMSGGMLDIDLGDLRTGWTKIQALLPRAAGSLREDFPGYLVRAMWLAGLCDFDAARSLGSASRGKSRQLLRFALWLEQPRELELALTHCVANSPAEFSLKVPQGDLDVMQAKLLMAAQNNDRKALARLDVECEAAAKRELLSVPDRFQILLTKAQVRRAAGQVELAAAAARECARELGALPADVTIAIEFRAMHFHNVLDLGLQESAKAREFFSTHYAGGFACFREWAEK